MTQEKFVQLIWESLKKQACVNPNTAVRIVMLHEHDVKNAIRNTPELLEFCKETENKD